MTVIDDYLKDIKPSQRAELQRIRNIVKQLVPMAEETISYGVPTFKYHGQLLLHVAAFKGHMSVFPGPEEVEAVKERLSKFKISKGTIQFTESDPIPEDIIKKFVTDRLDSIKKKTS